MRALAFLLVAALLGPAALAVPAEQAPVQAVAALPPLVLRLDPDGGRTFLLALEDDGAGDYAYTAAAHLDSTLQDVGTYTHPWTYRGLPELTVGAYVISQEHGLLRLPVVVLENADQDGLVDAVKAAVLTDGLGMANTILGFGQELLLPDQGEPEEQGLGLANYQEHPTIVAWHARRALPGADAWLGTYIARTGRVWDVEGGVEGLRSTELGEMLRLDGQDQRLAGVYLEQTARDVVHGQQQSIASDVTVGARSPAGRTPLATVRAEDARFGSNLSRPDTQTTTLTIGLQGPTGFVPLAGARLDAAERPTRDGSDITRMTAFGAFVDGAWVPLAGMRYHADRSALTELPGRLAAGGLLGSNQTGDAELSVGAFVLGAYTPLAEAALDDHFDAARYEHQTMVTFATATPLGRQPLASVTYDGTDSLVDWLLRVTLDTETGTAWLVSAGPWVGRIYSPVVGVRFQGDVPGSSQPSQVEFAVGTFLVDYTNFVPLLAVGAASDQPFFVAAAYLATNGMGQPGAWQVGVGSYPLADAYVPLVGVRYVPVQDPEAEAASDIVVDVAGVPAVGVQYRGAAPLLPSLGNPAQPGDDAAWGVAVGAYTPGFVPVLRLHHDGSGTTAVLGPDLPA